MEAFSTGLQLSLFGIVITFLALGLLILVIALLQVLFPAPKQEEETSPVSAEPPLEEKGPDARVVALTAAWWYWQNKRSSSLGKLLEKGPGKRWRKKEKA
jgi:Na+-transporting methylmalonyl-CoA/oxaloacetate decarboxylase gamma subunit